MTRATAPTLTLRPITAADHDAVLALIADDHLTGQPPATTAMLDEALAGRNDIDSGWWAELDTPRTDVALDPTGTVVGVVSYAWHRHDTTGVLLWLHGPRCSTSSSTTPPPRWAPGRARPTPSPPHWAFGNLGRAMGPAAADPPRADDAQPAAGRCRRR